MDVTAVGTIMKTAALTLKLIDVLKVVGAMCSRSSYDNLSIGIDKTGHCSAFAS
jgi:hypothetical protein